ncbi:ABC transporter ATP-binding protein [Cellulomonas chengniuliangii]|uniref:ABC transporter ATP-binding protein n=1 Tax=Cellulomonas chengniuliangii TaxID=2968084 RepID=UPI001D0F1A20|nr:ABC transporter ATP-binding protein [Cellulomonas chengniuliangii]MCC2318215.1 energy-coupling factor ABC transporter ATP-binding protein [Cellulomonas chengniuliangii]
MIRVRGLAVRYPRAARPVLDGLDLDVGPGEHVLLLGPSGAGKSTVLRVLAGIVPQSIGAQADGQARVAGLEVLGPGPVVDVPTLAMRVGTLTQDPVDQLVLPTVLDEVAFPLENRRAPRHEIGPRVERALRLVGAGGLIGRRTSELSGGEGQRVALAATLVADPHVLLLDEPTALLDPVGTRQVAAAARAAAQGRASVLVEHRLDEIGALPPRVVVLDERGRVRVDGPTRVVLDERPEELVGLGCWLPATAELRAAGFDSPARVAAAARRGPRAAAARPGQVVLEARSVEVRRAGRVVVGPVDLTVRGGTVTAVVGVNGSGKSSLLLALAGLLPCEGTVAGGSVGMAFQHPEHQLLTRSVRAELAYGPRAAGRVDALSVADRALSDLDLRGLAEQDPFRLSGGQQRRVSLAAMTVCDHDVLLADEPTFGQDRSTWGLVAAALRGLAEEGRGVVLVTHDLRLVGSLADEVVMLGGGRVLAAGPPDRVLSDEPLLDRAGLALPPLLRAWRASGAALRDFLDALDVGVRASSALRGPAASAVPR